MSFVKKSIPWGALYSNAESTQRARANLYIIVTNSPLILIIEARLKTIAGAPAQMLGFITGLYSDESLDSVYGNVENAASVMSLDATWVGMSTPSILMTHSFKQFMKSIRMNIVWYAAGLLVYSLKAIRYPFMVVGSLFYMPITKNFKVLGLWFEEVADIVKGVINMATYLPRAITGIRYLEKKLLKGIQSKVHRFIPNERVSAWHIFSPLLILTVLPELLVMPLEVVALLFYNFRAVPEFLVQKMSLLGAVLSGPFVVLSNLHSIIFPHSQVDPVAEILPIGTDNIGPPPAYSLPLGLPTYHQATFPTLPF
ncbi:hypothetical protein MMH89_00230 [Candidatus Comchoanobacter bicostacola]|uniref:Uncharacterized protein n=1 Tax=Candidatus Comchoanobacter bicostacola TaxID=2919598 RepID=A0ABY5DKT5_9GAMM|nr:hypothetical protein [Candidatus Comchoanobacter bicostacola]UTC24593.1 hypothetical protein MMH89_00230 [Candidatus Comchoanobacter bicostacola]